MDAAKPEGAAYRVWEFENDYNHVRPHSAQGGLAPETVRLNHAAGRLRAT